MEEMILKIFITNLSNSSIYFSMKDEKTGIPKVVNRPAGIVAKTPTIS